MAGAVASITSWASPSVRSPEETSSTTEMYAIRPSRLTWALPALVSGLTTCVTCGAFCSASTVESTAAAFSGSVIFPLGASSTTGFAPFAWVGNRCVSRSWAFWLS